MRILSTLLSLFISVSLAQAQLKDAEFNPAAPSKPAEFTDKGLFVVPTSTPPAFKPGTPVWTGGVELGFNGTDGNTEVLKMRFGANAKRQVENNLFTVDLVYGMARQMGIVSENKALLNARDELYFTDSPWGLFAASQVEYDQFRAFDFRVAVHSGFAYQFLRNDTTSLRGRIGVGVSREIGGQKDDWIPEGLLGFDFSHQVATRQRFVASGDFYPSLDGSNSYRIRTRAAYEISLDDTNCLTLRLGIQDRYDSNPGNAKRNDLDYFATILYKF